jgi:Na+:H+ antiporter, NhaA family
MAEQSQDGRRRLRAIQPLRDFLSTEAAGGVLLVLAAVVALAWSNSPWRTSYDSFWATEVGIRVGATHGLSLDLRHWVNEGLMVLFFFVVGLEIKRELVEGELRDAKRAALPAIAALGGMVVPAALFAAINLGTSAARGWAIPMATDIAMALGALSLLGRHLHPSHKLFLLALAIVDDIGAVVVIAVFYSKGIDVSMLALAGAALTTIVVLRRAGVQQLLIYVAVGIVLWYATKGAGLHATLAGVVLGLMTPTKPALSADLVDQDALGDISNLAAAQETMQLARQSVSVVEWLEHRLHPWTSYVVVPLFALANAGIRVSRSELREAASSRVAIGIVVGLVVGKTVGITAASWMAVRLGLATLPAGLTFRSIVGVASIAGIGFTVSLFIVDLAFVDSRFAAPAKLAVLAATVLAATLGGVLLRGVTRGVDTALE